MPRDTGEGGKDQQMNIVPGWGRKPTVCSQGSDFGVRPDDIRGSGSWRSERTVFWAEGTAIAGAPGPECAYDI
jgi:hypothetical protein